MSLEIGPYECEVTHPRSTNLSSRLGGTDDLVLLNVVDLRHLPDTLDRVLAEATGVALDLTVVDMSETI